MPLINGMKMACEPCIRGHRSTKCTHANERLMVPVRKPGRPLSACPHPRDSPCGCGSVTAAIPRKQTCHCGTDNTPPLTDSRPPTSSSSSDAPSPRQFTFKVGPSKVGKTSTSRKQSFDPTNFERMDMSQVNMMAFEQRPQVIPMPMVHGYALPPQIYGYPPQYPNINAQFNHLTMQMPPHTAYGSPSLMNGYSNGGTPGGLEHVIESPLATPTGFCAEELDNRGNDIAASRPKSAGRIVLPPSNGGSCCAPKKTHSHAPSIASIPESPEAPVSSCCSSKKISKQQAMSGSAHVTPHLSPLILPPNIIPYGHPMYQQYPQTTVFTYPPSYGSFQNPLQPQAWRQSLQTNNYNQDASAMPRGPLPFNAPLVPDTLDTVHTCCCGDSCQCIGCAAHPYNDATQEYVKSAWASMSMHAPSGESYTQERPNVDSNGKPAQSPIEMVTSPTAHTPSSATSVNGDEQSLPAGDFFFVNYPFASDGCGGDTQSCPCGDDCECLGCTIHRQPAVSDGCCGEKASCDCGDDCACLGCEFHGNA